MGRSTCCPQVGGRRPLPGAGRALLRLCCCGHLSGGAHSTAEALASPGVCLPSDRKAPEPSSPARRQSAILHAPARCAAPSLPRPDPKSPWSPTLTPTALPSPAPPLTPTGPISSFLVVSDPEAAKHVLRASDNPARPIYNKGLVAEVSKFLFGEGFAISGAPPCRWTPVLVWGNSSATVGGQGELMRGFRKHQLICSAGGLQLPPPAYLLAGSRSVAPARQRGIAPHAHRAPAYLSPSEVRTMLHPCFCTPWASTRRRRPVARAAQGGRPLAAPRLPGDHAGAGVWGVCPGAQRQVGGGQGVEVVCELVAGMWLAGCRVQGGGGWDHDEVGWVEVAV